MKKSNVQELFIPFSKELLSGNFYKIGLLDIKLDVFGYLKYFLGFALFDVY